MKAVAALIASCLALPAIAIPTQVDAEYRITTGGMTIGRVVETYVRQGDAYRIESTTHSEGMLKLIFNETVVVQSEGRIGPGGLVPLRFEQRRSGDRSRDIHAVFDWEKSALRSSYRGEDTTHALPSGTQDRLSIMYQFMNVTRGGTEVRMHMSNGRKVELYSYRLVDEPRLATPAGDFATLHYERITEGAREAHAQLWLATDRFNLPVRIVFEDANGLKLDQTLTRLTTR